MKKIRNITIIVLVLLLSGYFSGIRIVKVIGNSMFPTVMHGDKLLVSTLIYSVDRSDVVIAYCKERKKNIVKRVVGIPGDIVEIRGGYLYINFEIEDTSYLLSSYTNSSVFMELKDDQYFLLGDNRKISFDSRIFGPIKAENIIGEVVLRWAPIAVN